MQTNPKRGRTMSEESRGQIIKKNITKAMEGQLHKYVPNPFNRMANLIAYEFNLTPDTVRYNYLNMFIENGILIHTNNGELDLSAKGKALQIDEEQSEEDLKQEYTEYVEKKKETEFFAEYKKLPEPKPTFETWLDAKALKEKFKPQKENKKHIWQQYIESEAQKKPEISFETWKKVVYPNQP